MINEYLEDKYAQTEEMIGVELSVTDKNEIRKELIASLNLLAESCDVPVKRILGDIDLIHMLDELMQYNDGVARDYLLSHI